MEERRGGMANNLVLAQIYDQYLTTYSPRGTSAADTHKKSELRGVYNSIVKINKESPWVLQDKSVETRDFAVGVKEQARELKNTIYSVGGSDDVLQKKAAFSGNEDIVTAEYIGNGAEDETQSIEIKVNALASPQVNLGAFLTSEDPTLPAGTYSFDINLPDMSYEFQFGIAEGESNKDVQERIVRLINNTNIGLQANIIGDDRSRSAIRIASATTGISDDRELNFSINDSNSTKRKGAVDYFGLNYTAVMPKNAEFEVNGKPQVTNSNIFTIDKTFAVTLKGVSEPDSEPVKVGVKTDLESMADNIHTLVDGYNTFIKNTETFANALSRGRKLMTDIHKLSLYYKDDLNTLGISTNDDGTLTVNDKALRESASEDSLKAVKNFAGSLLRKTNQISINPMEYVDKTVVAYKNPGKSFASPYNTSQYSGMIFQGYC